MEKSDLRRVKKADKEALRVLAKKIYKKGISRKEISLYFGVRTRTISDWVKLYEQHGYQGLKEVKRGRKKGFGKLLFAEQEIQQMIIDKRLKINVKSHIMGLQKKLRKSSSLFSS